MSGVLRIVGCCKIAILVLAAQSGAHRVGGLYVEAFTSKAEAEGLREDVTVELGKLRRVRLVPQESGADLVLGGGGEIWIKGYRSLNPRSGRLPTNGTPVYSGYLSVELKDRNGVTLWSDLVTPGGAPEDLTRDLAKRVAKHVAEALDHIEASPPRAAAPQSPAIVLAGAGATFPYPVYLKWFANYHRENPSVQIEYEPIGSEGGIGKLLSGAIDFGASDSLGAIHELAPDEASKFLLFPSVVGAVVPIVNLPGISNEIRFTPEALAGIFLGKIKKWDDPVLRQSNRGVPLPDLDIVVVHRAEGSGTTYAWTEYLSRTSAEWRATMGASLLPRWPTGRAAAGNDGVAKLVKELAGSIGYVEFIYALQNHLSYGRVRNRNGEFVSAGLESLAAVVSHAAEIHDDLRMSLVDVPGAGTYPIASFSWLVVPASIPDGVKRGALTAFLRWMLGPGQQQAAALGYLSLPKELTAKEKDLIERIH